MSFSIEANLLTKAFFGSTKEIGSGIFSQTLPIPTIYTMAGALFTQLIKKYAICAEEIQDMIRNEELQIYGVYLKYGDKYYIPLNYQLIDKVDQRLELKLGLKSINEAYGDTIQLALSKFYKFYDMGEKGVLYLLNLDNLTERKVILVDDLREEERTRIGMDYPSRVAKEGILFTTTYEDLGFKMKFCVDVVTKDRRIEKLDNWIGNLGGEGTLASFMINEKTHFVDKVKNNYRGYKGYIAVSHIPILLRNNIIISYFGEIDSIIGSIEPIGGWLLERKEQKMKRIFPSIKPGSLFYTRSKEYMFETELWYLNLLKSAIPIDLLQ
ncbi:MAG: type III-B CRISPR module-associated Cmr3 family protein [Thermoprotei archaeon]